MTETVETMKRIEDLNGFSEAACDLANEIVSDTKSDPYKRLAGLTQAGKFCIAMRAEQRAALRDLTRLGLKPTGQLKNLTFQVAADEE